MVPMTKVPMVSTTGRAALSLNPALSSNKYLSAAKDVSAPW
jgi:hypothetical protein